MPLPISSRVSRPTSRSALWMVCPNVSARIIELLRYPADMAGGIMTNDLVVAPVALTVTEARHVLRDQLAEPDFIYYIYVVDAAETRLLRGVVTVRDLLLADDARSLEEIMRGDMVTIDP